MRADLLVDAFGLTGVCFLDKNTPVVVGIKVGKKAGNRVGRGVGSKVGSLSVIPPVTPPSAFPTFCKAAGSCAARASLDSAPSVTTVTMVWGGASTVAVAEMPDVSCSAIDRTVVSEAEVFNNMTCSASDALMVAWALIRASFLSEDSVNRLPMCTDILLPLTLIAVAIAVNICCSVTAVSKP